MLSLICTHIHARTSHVIRRAATIFKHYTSGILLPFSLLLAQPYSQIYLLNSASFMCYVVLNARCSAVSSAPPYLTVNTVNLNYELFPLYNNGIHREHTKRVLLSERHKVSRYTCACNCIYVHKVEVRPWLLLFSRNSPSFSNVMLKSHVLN